MLVAPAAALSLNITSPLLSASRCAAVPSDSHTLLQVRISRSSLAARLCLTFTWICARVSSGAWTAAHLELVATLGFRTAATAGGSGVGRGEAGRWLVHASASSGVLHASAAAAPCPPAASIVPHMHAPATTGSCRRQPVACMQAVCQRQPVCKARTGNEEGLEGAAQQWVPSGGRRGLRQLACSTGRGVVDSRSSRISSSRVGSGSASVRCCVTVDSSAVGRGSFRGI